MEASDVRCKNCGKTFPLMASEAAGDADEVTNEEQAATCPHCGQTATYGSADFVTEP